MAGVVRLVTRGSKGWSSAGVDILIVSLGSTAGLRSSDAETAGMLQRAGAEVRVVVARRPRELRTYALTDLSWAISARLAARKGIAEHQPRAVIYSTVTAAMFWPRPGAIRYDAPAAANRLGRHGIWQRPVERRVLARAPLLIPVDAGTLRETPKPHADAIVVPIPVQASAAAGGAAQIRDIAAITYAANPHKKGLDRIIDAWDRARVDGEELVVTGADVRLDDVPGVRVTGPLQAAAYRALLRRSRVFIAAPRREDYGLAQLEALVDGCILVTTTAPGPYAALPIAKALDPRLVVSEDAPLLLAAALRAALDAPLPGYAERAAAATAPFSRDAIDIVVRDEVLPRLLP